MFHPTHSTISEHDKIIFMYKFGIISQLIDNLLLNYCFNTYLCGGPNPPPYSIILLLSPNFYIFSILLQFKIFSALTICSILYNISSTMLCFSSHCSPHFYDLLHSNLYKCSLVRPNWASQLLGMMSDDGRPRLRPDPGCEPTTKLSVVQRITTMVQM